MDTKDQEKETKMKKMIRERGDNWTREEKDLFLEIMKESAPIIENKQTDTNTNKKKVAEWLKVQSKLKEFTGKVKEVAQLKGFWRRTKLTAKKHVSEHKKSIRSTGGGLPPPFPPEEDLKIMELCPTDFIIEVNEFDSDAISQKPDHIDIAEDGSTIYDIEINETIPNEADDVEEIITVADVHNNEVHIETSQNSKKEKKNTKDNKKIKVYPEKTKNESSHKGMIVMANIDLKNRSRQMMEEEHKLKMQFHEQQLVHQQLRNKMKIEILQLEKEEKELIIKLLKKQL